jgi:heme-degrading monooxygenase HmoA
MSRGVAASSWLRSCRGALLLVGAGLAAACRVATPFRGPGFDDDVGALAEVPQSVVVAITAGRIEAGGASAFAARLDEVLAALPANDGLVGFSVRRELFGDRIWTLSAWRDDDSLDRFLASPEHVRAVREGGVPRSSVVFVRVPLPKALLPLSWPQAERLLGDEP